MGSMVAGRLHRVSLMDGQVALVEPIDLGRRIRDIAEHHDGRIIMWMDEGSIATLEPSQAPTNMPYSFAACAACHTTYKNGPNGIGPNLWDVYGSTIASQNEFNYSDSFLSNKGEWDYATLNRFLENPSRFARGTTMIMPGIQKEETRNQIISYLQHLKD